MLPHSNGQYNSIGSLNLNYKTGSYGVSTYESAGSSALRPFEIELNGNSSNTTYINGGSVVPLSLCVNYIIKF